MDILIHPGIGCSSFPLYSSIQEKAGREGQSYTTIKNYSKEDEKNLEGKNEN